jgi:hypothetical protein
MGAANTTRDDSLVKLKRTGRESPSFTGWLALQ